MVKVVAWDFDGVLNHNIVDGCFLWAQTFEQDTGQSLDVFVQHVFARDFDAILTGKEDVRDRVKSWADEVGYEAGPDALLAYWFDNDARPDADMLLLMDELSRKGIRQVIATNNEPRRTAYIENEMGFGRRVERVFSSGRLGVRKPNPAFFRNVTDALDVSGRDMLLLDDAIENIDQAAELGWRTLHVNDANRAAVRSHLPL